MISKDFLIPLLSMTKKKIQNGLDSEYREIVQNVPPAGKDQHGQHDTMVLQGLCPSAVKNSHKNRYSNLFPFEHSLVKIPSEPEFYINANWVKYPEKGGPECILTMGPLGPSAEFYVKDSLDTRADFWKMILDTKAENIIMLCSVQHGYTGCSKYFPIDLEDSIDFDNEISIHLEDIEVFDNYTFRLFRVNGRIIKHFQYTAWPNYDIPESPESLADFVEFVYGKIRRETTPELVVHCSGGIGRSGAFYAVYSFFSCLQNDILNEDFELCVGGELNLSPLVVTLRKQRHPWMVEGEEQYSFAYETCVTFLKRKVSSL